MRDVTGRHRRAPRCAAYPSPARRPAALGPGLVPARSTGPPPTPSCRRGAPRRIVEIGSGHSTRFLAQRVADGGLDLCHHLHRPGAARRLAGLPRASRPARAGRGRPATRSPGWPPATSCSSIRAMSPCPARTSTACSDGCAAAPARRACSCTSTMSSCRTPIPEAWAWRGYNEQLAVACLLQGAGFRIVFASRWIRTRRPAWTAEAGLDTIVRLDGAYETSLWLAKAQSGSPAPESAEL